MYSVYRGDKVVKTYPHKLQCIIWAMMRGYATCRGGKHDIRWVPEIKIKNRG